MIENYLHSVKKQFIYNKQLGDQTFDQLSPKEMFWQSDASSNSIAIIVKHLWGNMQSRWTNFLTEDGEKTWRKRDDEFEISELTKNQVIDLWEEGWKTLFDSLEQIDSSNFDQLVYIRNMGHTITEAINRQLAHYSYHVGQIVFIGKVIKKQHWTSLSIPLGESKSYNKEKFSKGKRNEHFTDDL